MTDVTLRNINPIGAHRCGTLGRTLEAGEEFTVSAKVAGREPVHTVDEDGLEDFDPGEGLLAQSGNYELVVSKLGGPTVDELRTELKERGLDPKGLKADLIARLAAADAAAVADAEAARLAAEDADGEQDGEPSPDETPDNPSTTKTDED